jgi:coenzyme F420 hydrogenase subunit delta
MTDPDIWIEKNIVENEQFLDYSTPTLVLGCGNVLLGDDGFGPAVARTLAEDHPIPTDAVVINAGTSVRKVLFSVAMGGTDVERIFIVDSVNYDDGVHAPGEIFEISIEDIPTAKLDDFSMHQIPSSNLLREISDYRNIYVRIFVCQVERIPDLVEPGLTIPVQEAVPMMCERILKEIRTPRSEDR